MIDARTDVIPGALAAKVLVVEDEEALAELLRYNLEAAGYNVVHAATGEDAEVLVTEEEPDLVILDWMLPAASGIEICRRLRARTDTRQVPIIMLTARSENDRIRGLTRAPTTMSSSRFLPELMARVRAILRRTSPERIASVLSAGDIELDRDPIALRATDGRFISGRRNSGCSSS